MAIKRILKMNNSWPDLLVLVGRYWDFNSISKNTLVIFRRQVQQSMLVLSFFTITLRKIDCTLRRRELILLCRWKSVRLAICLLVSRPGRLSLLHIVRMIIGQYLDLGLSNLVQPLIMECE